MDGGLEGDFVGVILGEMDGDFVGVSVNMDGAWVGELEFNIQHVPIA